MPRLGRGIRKPAFISFGGSPDEVFVGLITHAFQNNAFQDDAFLANVILALIVFTPERVGPTNVSPVLVSLTFSVYTPENLKQQYQPTLLTNPPVFYTPEAINAGLALTVTPTVTIYAFQNDAFQNDAFLSSVILMNVPIIYAPQLNAHFVYPDLISNPVLLRDPGFSEVVTDLSFILNLPVFYAPKVGPFIAVDLLSNTPTIYAPLVTYNIDVTPGIITNTLTVTTPLKISVPVAGVIFLRGQYETNLIKAARYRTILRLSGTNHRVMLKRGEYQI